MTSFNGRALLQSCRLQHQASASFAEAALLFVSAYDGTGERLGTNSSFAVCGIRRGGGGIEPAVAWWAQTWTLRLRSERGCTRRMHMSRHRYEMINMTVLVVGRWPAVVGEPAVERKCTICWGRFRRPPNFQEIFSTSKANVVFFILNAPEKTKTEEKLSVAFFCGVLRSGHEILAYSCAQLCSSSF